MPTEKPTRAKRAVTRPRRAPRPNNPFGIDNEEFTKLSLEASEKYSGKCIAWSRGHDKILAAGETFKEVDDELGRLGLDASAVIYEFVEPYMYGQVMPRNYG
jgi:hypothetical protein